MGGLIAIGELARRTGTNIETIRYYERIGLLPRPQRRGRYRCYERADVERLGFVRRARELGFSLDEVKALLKLSISEGSCADAREIAAAHLIRVEAKISDLLRMQYVLASAVHACDTGSEAECPLIEALSNEHRLSYCPG